MSRSRTAGVLWLIAGVSTAGIAFFIVDPVTLGVFITGAIAGGCTGFGLPVPPILWSGGVVERRRGRVADRLRHHWGAEHHEPGGGGPLARLDPRFRCPRRGSCVSLGRYGHIGHEEEV
jgi:hypothetical protein